VVQVSSPVKASRAAPSICHLGFAAVAWALLAACSEADSLHCHEVATKSAALVGGTPHDELLGLDERGENAVVAVLPKGDSSVLCSGVLIGGAVVVSAAHCVVEGDSPKVRIGPDALNPLWTADVARIFKHATRDLILLHLSERVPLEFAQPIAPLRNALDLVGIVGLVSGFGVTEDGTSTARRFARETIVEQTEVVATVAGEGQRGACAGDSGGPLIVRDALDQVRVAGVLSQGSASCVELDYYVLLEPVIGWIDAQLNADCTQG
jgi:hypothetical protein